MKIILLLFVFAFNLAKADLESMHYFEFMIYTSNGDSIEGYSDFPYYVFADSVTGTEIPKEKLKEFKQEKPDSISFWLKRSSYTFYPETIGDTSTSELLFKYYNPTKLATSDIKLGKEIDHFTSRTWYDIEEDLKESDASWSNYAPDTIARFNVDELLEYFYCIHDYNGENQKLYDELITLCNSASKHLDEYFSAGSEEKGVAIKQELDKKHKRIEQMINKLQKMGKIVIVYFSSC